MLNKPMNGKPCGLPNFSNTCYLNSILQILCQIPEIMSLLDGCRRLPAPSGVAPEKMQTCGALMICIVEHGKDPNNEAADQRRKPDVVQATLSRLCSCLGRLMASAGHLQFQHQDQNEYLNILLTLIHDCTAQKKSIYINSSTDETNLDRLEKKSIINLQLFGSPTTEVTIPNDSTDFYDSIVTRLFTGQFYWGTECSLPECRHISALFEPFRTWELEIHGNHLIDCIERFTTVSHLDEDQLYECDKCKQKNRSYRRALIWRLPEILIISLKRFTSTYNKNTGSLDINKHNNNVTVPLDLDLSKYLGINRGPEHNPNYGLFAIGNHIGNTTGGHCYSYVNTSQSNKANSSSWYVVDDMKIQEIVMNQRQSFGGSTPYLLFYRRKKD